MWTWPGEAGEWGNAAKDGWDSIQWMLNSSDKEMQLGNFNSSHLFPFTGTYGWNRSGGQIKRIQKSRAWEMLFPLDEIKILNLRGRRNADPCEEAILEEEGGWGGAAEFGSLRAAQLLSLPTAGRTLRAGGAALAPGSQINLLSFSFPPKLDE